MKQLLIHAIMGAPTPEMKECDSLTKEGIMVWTGNQHNPSWKWVEPKLQECGQVMLMALYEKLTK